MKQVAYQEEYINELTETAVKLLNDKYRDQGTIVLKAPTGSGKTYMISQAITQIVKKQGSIVSYCFIWLSVNSLHEQSRQSLSQYLEDERLWNVLQLMTFKITPLKKTKLFLLIGTA